jgi:hypothetical protein
MRKRMGIVLLAKTLNFLPQIVPHIGKLGALDTTRVAAVTACRLPSID